MKRAFLRIGRSGRLFIATAAVAWLLAAGSSISEAYGGPAWTPAFTGVLVAVFLTAVLLASWIRGRNSSLQDPETLLRNLVVGGLAVLSLLLLGSSFLRNHLPEGPSQYFMAEVYPTLVSLPFTLYAAAVFILLRKLHNERTEATRHPWAFLLVFTGLTAWTAVARMPTEVLIAVYGLALVMGFPLLFRVRWIAALSRRDRPYVLAYLVLGCAVLAGLVLQFLVLDMPGIYHRPAALANPFPLILLGFSLGYLTLATLAVIFHWPVAAVMERRNAEIASFQMLHDRIAGRASDRDIETELFDMCFRQAEAHAGWLTRPLHGHRQVQYLKRGDISVEQISDWERDLRRAGVDGGGGDGHFYCRRASGRRDLDSFTPSYETVLVFPVGGEEDRPVNLVLLRRDGDAFDGHAIRVLGTYVNQARLALEKSRLVDEAVESERLRNDFEIARQVQSALLPRTTPSRDWLDLAVEYNPASEVGGDYYDFFEAEDRLHLVVGDVSGKGMGAAFNVAELKGIFQSNREHLDDPVEFLARANRAVSVCFEPGTFLTMVLLSFHQELNEFRYARAGHCPLLHYRAADKTADYLKDEGLGLGIIRQDDFRPHVRINHRRYEANDLVVLYSDGVIEAQDLEGNEYGYERLRDVVARHGYFNVEEVKGRILEDVRSFVGGSDAGDDITLLVAKFL